MEDRKPILTYASRNRADAGRPLPHRIVIAAFVLPWPLALVLGLWVVLAVRIWPAKGESMSAIRKPTMDMTLLMGFTIPFIVLGLGYFIGLWWLWARYRHRHLSWWLLLGIGLSMCGAGRLLLEFVLREPVVVL